ncbi:hypothetical protein [Nannocystis pusilla]|uniref:hypothetical protein n=1 Tax=Nannocystis pusilla TaxID=889268 RepID=UPI003DA1FA5F
MKAAAKYMTVTHLEKRLRLRGVVCRHPLSPGVYRVLVGGEWAEMEGVEPRINSASAPLRPLELSASGDAVEQVMRLEAELRASGGPLQMEVEGSVVSVPFQELMGRFSLYGVFHRERGEAEVACRIRLAERTIKGIGIDVGTGDRRLALMEWSLDDEAAVARAFAGKQPITVEQIPWD